jgi:hypothetical protein
MIEIYESKMEEWGTCFPPFYYFTCKGRPDKQGRYGNWQEGPFVRQQMYAQFLGWA